MPGGLIARVHAHLNDRLDPGSAAPLALGFSGGGDSLALLTLALAWARPRGREVLALTVDHGLNSLSAEWTAAAGAQALALGARWRSLAWMGAKPTTGLPEAARRARHALLAEAARGARASVVLLGHTADDLAEGEVLRAQGGTLGRVRAWGPSPAWPEGRGVFLLRPMLEVSRATLRAHLTTLGLTWLEDPANSDPRFARARVRAARDGSSPVVSRDSGDSGGLSRGPGVFEDARVPTVAATRGDKGRLRPARDLEAVGAIGLPRDADAATLARALLCASGHDVPPRGAALDRLRARLSSPGVVTAVLAGARAVADGDTVLICREAGEALRGGLAPMRIESGQVAIWDGRFEIESETGGEVRPVRGLAARLDAADRARLSGLTAAVRPTLPVLIRDGAARPVLAERIARVRSLTAERFRAACGEIAHESEIGEGPRGAAPRTSLCCRT